MKKALMNFKKIKIIQIKYLKQIYNKLKHLINHLILHQIMIIIKIMITLKMMIMIKNIAAL